MIILTARVKNNKHKNSGDKNDNDKANNNNDNKFQLLRTGKKRHQRLKRLKLNKTILK